MKGYWILRLLLRSSSPSWFVRNAITIIHLYTLRKTPYNAQSFRKTSWRIDKKIVFFHVKQLEDFYSINDALLHLPYHLLTPDIRTILDIGGNIGATSAVFRVLYPNATIHVIEPNPSLTAQLRLNTQHPKTQIHVIAIASQNGNVAFSQGTSHLGGHITIQSQADSTVRIPSHTLQAFLDNQHLDRVDLLKCDIEGAEEAIIQQNQFAKKARLVLIELHPTKWKETRDITFSCQDLLSGYSLLEQKMNGRHIECVFRIHEDDETLPHAT